jgi:peptide maturation system protein (TIGR04066 family)
MKKKATIYPYSKDDVQFFRYASMLKEIEPVFAVSPSGWGLCGKDVTEIDGGVASGLKITDDITHALKNSELLVLTSFEKYHGEEGGLSDTIKLAIENKVPFILYFPPDKANDCDTVEGLLQEAERLGLFRNKQELKNSEKLGGLEHCVSLNTPVTLIAGQGPNTGKFETQLGMRQELLQRGLKILQVGTRPYCELFDFHSFPGFMFNKELDETEKVISFNHYLKKIETIEKPDLIVVGIPGGIMPFMEKVHNNYGILHVEVASAMEPDNLVYTLYSNYYTTEYYKRSVEFLFNRLNKTMPACFILTNFMVDYESISEHELFNVITLDKMYDKVIEKPGNGIPAISILEPGAFTKATSAMLSLLEVYGSVETF